jgi:hypothetical protein
VKLTVRYHLFEPENADHDIYEVEIEFPGMKPDVSEIAPLLDCLFGAIDQAATDGDEDDDDDEQWKKEPA